MQNAPQSQSTPGEMIGEVVDLTGGLAVVLLPLLVIVLMLILPSLLVVALVAAPVALVAALAAPPYLL